MAASSVKLELLALVHGLAIEPRLCQEDWGVFIFAERDGKRFWIGLTWWPEGEGEWLVDVHHGGIGRDGAPVTMSPAR